MIKAFFKNSFIYIIGTILTRGFGVLLIPIYTRYLSPLEYGIVDLFVILTSIITLTIALEIHQAVVRFYQDADSEESKRQYVSSAFMFSIFIYSIYFVISVLFCDSFTVMILDDIKYRDIFLLASGAIATSGLFYFSSGQLRWQILPKESVTVSILHFVTVAIVAIYLLIIQNLKAESIFIGQIAGNIIGIFLSIYYTRKSYRFIFVYEKLKEMIAFSYPLVFSGIAIFVTLYIDRLIIKHLLGLEELGIYGLAYKFASITSLVMIGFQSSLSPLIYKHFKESETPKNIAKLFDLFVIFAIFVVVGAILFSKEVLFIMATEEYYPASPLIPFLVITVFFLNMYIFTPGLAIAKKTKIISLISIAGALVNTMLNLALIPLFGLIGATYATMTSAIIVFIITLMLSNKYYSIEYSWLKKILIFLFMIFFSFIVNSLFNNINFESFLVKGFVLILSFILIVYVIVGSYDLKNMFGANK